MWTQSACSTRCLTRPRERSSSCKLPHIKHAAWQSAHSRIDFVSRPKKLGFCLWVLGKPLQRREWHFEIGGCVKHTSEGYTSLGWLEPNQNLGWIRPSWARLRPCISLSARTSAIVRPLLAIVQTCSTPALLRLCCTCPENYPPPSSPRWDGYI